MTLVSDYQRRSISQSLFFQTTSSPPPPLPTPVNNVIVGVFSFTALSIVVFLIFYCLRKLRKDQSSPYNDNPRIPFRRVLHSSENFLFEYDRHFFPLHNFLFPVTSRNSENTTATTTTIPLVPNPLYHDLEGCYSIARSQIEVKFLLASGQFGKVFKGR